MQFLNVWKFIAKIVFYNMFCLKIKLIEKTYLKDDSKSLNHLMIVRSLKITVRENLSTSENVVQEV